MNYEPRYSRFEVRCGVAVAIALLLGAFTAAAQQTNAPANSDPRDYNSYRIITERNIFNQNRTGRYVRATTRQSRSRPTQAVAETFSLVGTMAYPKGRFAFFDGTGGDYKKVLEPGATIAGYTLKEVTAQNVTLVGTNNVSVKMNVGTQMRREENGWQLAEHTETATTSSNASAEPAPSSAGAADSGMEMNDVLKKLMQQREQEDSK